MAAKIILEPEECWQYVQDHKEELSAEMHLIAEETDYGVQVFLEAVDNLPYFTVNVDDVPIHNEFCLGVHDAEETAAEIYEKYIDEAFKTLSEIDDLDDTNEFSWEDNPIEYDDWLDFDEEFDDKEFDLKMEISNEQLICERETELDDCINWFLDTVSDKLPVIDFEDDDIEDIKDHFCEYVARKYGVNIWRPMYLEGEDGKDFYTEYPYEAMVYDDPGNPIYKK